ncbi:MAG: hypothetical protein CMB99_12645 [Flavobacteriaceae bacterium]|nr:hypothetical protein [Flavobacteriaceae bacterium]
MNYSSKPLVTFFSLYLTLISTSLCSQTTDSIKGPYRYHRFTKDYQYLLFTVSDFNESQKIYDTHNKELVDWDNFPKDNYEPHASYNVYEGYDRKSYLLRYLSTVKNTGKERKSAYDQTGHNPLVTVSLKNFVRILPDGSFLCKEEKKRQRLEYYILSPDGKRRKLKHKFRSKFTPPQKCILRMMVNTASLDAFIIVIINRIMLLKFKIWFLDLCWTSKE